MFVFLSQLRSIQKIHKMYNMYIHNIIMVIRLAAIELSDILPHTLSLSRGAQEAVRACQTVLSDEC
ncbi:MAG: hypothetical protein CME88_17560 [Hirschia sp.]|nr:hypothetical protein [Hirschia sp.]